MKDGIGGETMAYNAAIAFCNYSFINCRGKIAEYTHAQPHVHKHLNAHRR